MRLSNWEDAPDLAYNRIPFSDLTNLAFTEALVPPLGPVAVGLSS